MSTEEEVAAAVRAALRIVDEADVPDDLRSVVFEKAYSSLTVVADAAAQQTFSPSVEGARLADVGADNDEVARIASKLRVERRLVERVLEIDEDGAHIIVPRSRLAKQKSVAIQQVATLVVAARQAAGREEWTPQTAVRAETEALGVDDRSNFASHIKNVLGIRGRGSGRTGELRMNAVGFESAAELISQLAQEVSR